ncbi:helix-turn-helix domain-containing protein [Ruegeria pomeroyi]|nr:helix-turn-helix domain-containing protein [Ruegeria pomeroyi]
MSVYATNLAVRAIRATKLKPAAALVLHTLAWHHNHQTGRCDPSNATLCEETGLSERGVRDAIGQLKDAGIIKVTARTQKSGRGHRNLTNRYTFAGGAKFAGRMVLRNALHLAANASAEPNLTTQL